MEPRRRIVAGLTATAVLLIVIGSVAVLLDIGLSGAGPVPAFTGATPSNSLSIAAPDTASPGAIPSPSPRIGSQPPLNLPSPFVSPAPSRHPVGFAISGAVLVYYADDGTSVPVPAVAGLRVEVRGGKALYLAVAGNRYGLKAGAVAGEFKPNVTTEQADGSSAQTGGIVASGPVASRLISDRLASMKAGPDRWIVALPVDVRQEPAASMVTVTFDTLGLHGLSDTPRVVVRFDGQMPITEAVPANGGFHVLVEGLGVTAWQVIDPTRLGLPADKIDATHAMNELLVYGGGAPSLTSDFSFDARVVVGQKMLSATGDVSVSMVVAGSRADLGPDRLLRIGDVPVFVASS
jgi:hypothetical protein